LSQVPPNVLTEFGLKVQAARSLKGWTLGQLGFESLGRDNAKSFISNIEKGQRQISATTAGKLITALDLDKNLLTPFLNGPAPTDPTTEETATDRDAERLMRRSAADKSLPPTAEALMIALAYEFAQGSHIDLDTAYNGLRAALAAAADIKARGALPQNTGDQLQAVLREVARLNDLGERQAAADTLDEAMAQIEAQREAIFNLQLDQDRILNNPEAAAKRLIQNLHQSAPPGGVWNATHDLLIDWREKGETQGSPFDLQVALHLAKNNWTRAKGGQKTAAVFDLGTCNLAIGERSAADGPLKQAVKVFREALKLAPRRSDPENWATIQNSLGIALRKLGERQQDPARLNAAIDAYTDALTVRTRTAAPMDWAMTQNNLGTALASLGERQQDPTHLNAAIDAFTAALTAYTRTAAPMDWAATQNNLGNALRALGERQQDPARLNAAIDAITAALTVYTRAADPMGWAMTQNNFGLALRWLADLTADPDPLHRAQAAYDMCLLERTQDNVPFDWARTQWNLADLALVRHRLALDPAHLVTAQQYLDAARAVFEEGPSDHQLARCDELQTRIDAAKP